QSAQAAYRAMTRIDAQDYEKVKAEILRRLGITPERHHQAFRRKKSREAKAPRVLWQSLIDLTNKWLQPEATSKEGICDQILLEQFMADLDEDTQRWVRCHCPTSSLEALQLAEHFDMAQGEMRRERGMRGQDINMKKDKENKENRKARRELRSWEEGEEVGGSPCPDGGGGAAGLAGKGGGWTRRGHQDVGLRSSIVRVGQRA
uniref:SCAN box domain-containing protein n=1 Tax=Crocodylus porosus TaxID=8502 RepID=A0A7M4EAI7_CROPO